MYLLLLTILLSIKHYEVKNILGNFNWLILNTLITQMNEFIYSLEDNFINQTTKRSIFMEDVLTIFSSSRVFSKLRSLVN